MTTDNFDKLLKLFSEAADNYWALVDAADNRNLDDGTSFDDNFHGRLRGTRPIFDRMVKIIAEIDALDPELLKFKLPEGVSAIAYLTKGNAQ
jgi:hypothetical protein